MEARRYTSLAITLHWLVAIGIIINVFLALTWEFYPEESIRPAINLHKSIGITVLGLAIMRLLWRFTHTPPALPTGYAKWEVQLSHVTHVLLYVIIFAMPLTGWMHDSAWKAADENPLTLFGVIPFPRISYIMNLDAVTKEQMHDLFGEFHEIAAYAIYVLVGLHVLGALKHQFFDKQRELQRMWFTGDTE